jgi:peptide/nickel transport system substrate-binding protein
MRIGISVAAAVFAMSLAQFTHAMAEDMVTIVVPDSIDTLDPCRTARNDVGRIIKQNVVETLTQLSPADGKLMPRLATSWEETAEATWRFHLRENVKFHDGSSFDAASFTKAVERTLNPKLDCIVQQKFFGGITLTVTTVDDYTVDIKASPPQPILPVILSTLAISASSTPFDEATNDPIGTGPFKLKAWQPGQSAELEGFADYWGEKPVVTSARYVFRGESAVQAAMVATGEADLAPYISVQDATNPETDHSYLNTETAQIALALEHAPLNDIRVRKALNMAIDRQAFIGTIFSADVQPASQIVLPFINGYNPDLKPWAYDLEGAKALLAEAKADGVPVDKEIILFGRPGFLPNQSDVLQALSQMWQEAGFNVRVQMIEKAQFIDLVGRPHEGDRPVGLFFNLHDNSTGDAANTLYFKYSSKGGQSQGQDAELDKLIEVGMQATGEERTKLFRQTFTRITNEMVDDVILFHFVGYARVGPRIVYEPTPFTNNEVHIEDIRWAD